MNTNQKLFSGRLMAVERLKYLRSAILGLVPVKAPAGLTMPDGSPFDTFATRDDMVMYFAETAVQRWTVEQIAGAFVHEAFHILRKHSARCRSLAADPPLFNIASDMEINDDLRAARLQLPEGVVYPEAIGAKEGLLAEEYYRLLEKEQQGGGKGKKGGKGGQPGQGKGPGRPVPGGGHCGGCAGNPFPGEGEAKSKDGQNGQNKGIGRSEAEMERMRRQVAEEIQKEAQKGRGSVPAGWVRWAETQLSPPEVPWEQELARAVRSAIAYRPGAVDYKFTHVSRRQGGLGYGPGAPRLPALRAPVPEVAVGADTSGSMGEREVMRAASETQGILRTVGAHVTFAACDADVHSLKKVRNVKELAALMKGGGGTDMRPMLDAFNSLRPRPEVAVIITDGQIGDPGPEPRGMQVIWVIVGPYGQMDLPWGKVIRVKEKGEKEEAA